MFRPESNWKERVTAITMERARGKATDSALSDVGFYALNPNRWIPLQEGLQINFDPYDGGCYVCNPDVTIPWAELKDVLAVSAPIPD